MSLAIKQGDLFKHATADCIIAHGCNAQGKMGKGFAYQLRLKYPLAAAIYFREFRESGLRLGETIFTHHENCVTIVHCITQQYYGQKPGIVYASEEAMRRALTSVCSFSKQQNLPIHVPLIGANYGGMGQERSVAILTEAFDDVDATLWIKNRHD